MPVCSARSTGSVILGLEIWPDEEGEITEAPLSVYPGGATESNIEPARLYAIEALRRVPGFGWSNPSILVTWSDPT